MDGKLKESGAAMMVFTVICAKLDPLEAQNKWKAIFRARSIRRKQDRLCPGHLSVEVVELIRDQDAKMIQDVFESVDSKLALSASLLAEGIEVSDFCSSDSFGQYFCKACGVGPFHDLNSVVTHINGRKHREKSSIEPSKPALKDRANSPTAAEMLRQHYDLPALAELNKRWWCSWYKALLTSNSGLLMMSASNLFGYAPPQKVPSLNNRRLWCSFEQKSKNKLLDNRHRGLVMIT
eukprot:symbB.v1.2.032102.t1/scaffold3808.1/size49906/2